MARLYTAELFSYHGLVSDVVDIPDGELWVIREVFVFSAGLGGGANFQIVKDLNSATIYYLNTPLELGNSWNDSFDHRLVLNGGESYTLSASGSPDVTGFGFKLTLP